MTENTLIKDLEQTLNVSKDKRGELVERAMSLLRIMRITDVSSLQAEYLIYLCGCLESQGEKRISEAVAGKYDGKTYLRNLVTFDLPEAPGLQAEIMSRVGKTNVLEVQVREMPKDGRSWTTTNKDLMIDGKYFGTLTYFKDNNSDELLRIKYLGFIPNLEHVAFDDLTNMQEIQRQFASDSIEIVRRALYADFYVGSLDEIVCLRASKREIKEPFVRDDAFTEGKLNLKLQ